MTRTDRKPFTYLALAGLTSVGLFVAGAWADGVAAQTTTAECAGVGERGSNPAFGGISAVNPGLANVGAVVGPGAAAACLTAQSDSGVTGEASLLALGAMTTVSVTLEGLAPNSAHAGHVHDGSCSGAILVPLETITADATGRGRATSTVDGPIAPGTWYIQYHTSDSPPGPPIVCGPVAGS